MLPLRKINYILAALFIFVLRPGADLLASDPGSSGEVNNPEVSGTELMIQYLKDIQDHFSFDGLLVPAMEDNHGQTFNNAVTAMAFILTGEKERAERILDFYTSRTDTSNSILNYQNFFYNGEARGFFQSFDLYNSYTPFITDRWMGDNAWLLIAFKYYEAEYGFSSKPAYANVTSLFKNMLLDFYIDDPGGHGGFVRHGWRWGPRNSPNPVNDYELHLKDSLGNFVGHEEGNIDAYAVFKLCGEDEKAAKIKEWLDYRMDVLGSNDGLPLDLFSWRSLAFTHEGSYYKELVNIPENDPGFRKQVTFMGREPIGFYSFDAIYINNVWLDGTGHMVCAFYSAGYPEKGDFYSAQLDSFLITRNIAGSATNAVPYTANTDGGYGWVDITKGFSSSCAWYIFAKYGFNPFTFERNLPSAIEEGMKQGVNFKLNQNFPNPFNLSTTISYSLNKAQQVKVIIFDALGSRIRTLYKGEASAGLNMIGWNGRNNSAQVVPSGVYLYRVITEDAVLNGKMVLNK